MKEMSRYFKEVSKDDLEMKIKTLLEEDKIKKRSVIIWIHSM